MCQQIFKAETKNREIKLLLSVFNDCNLVKTPFLLTFFFLSAGMFVLFFQDLRKIMHLLCDVCTCVNVLQQLGNLLKLKLNLILSVTVTKIQ